MRQILMFHWALLIISVQIKRYANKLFCVIEYNDLLQNIFPAPENVSDRIFLPWKTFLCFSFHWEDSVSFKNENCWQSFLLLFLSSIHVYSLLDANELLVSSKNYFNKTFSSHQHHINWTTSQIFQTFQMKFTNTNSGK